jgi:transposase
VKFVKLLNSFYAITILLTSCRIFTAHTYSIDLRKRILQDINVGLSPKAVAQKYSVSIPWVYSFIKRYRESNSIKPKEYIPGGKKETHTV